MYVPFLAGGVPDLGLDDLVVDVDAAGGELDADGGLGLEAELVAREAREQVRLADAGVPDEHHLEEVVVVVVRPVRHRHHHGHTRTQRLAGWLAGLGPAAAGRAVDEEGSADGRGRRERERESTRTRVRVFSQFLISPRFFARFAGFVRCGVGAVRTRARVVVGWVSRAHAEPPAGGAGEVVEGWKVGKTSEKTSERAVFRRGLFSRQIGGAGSRAGTGRREPEGSDLLVVWVEAGGWRTSGRQVIWTRLPNKSRFPCRRLNGGCDMDTRDAGKLAACV